MPLRKARLFTNGGSQAVRLPADFRFDDDEVFIRRDEITGDVILSKRPGWASWDEYFALRDAAAVPDDFMADRPLNEPPRKRVLFKGRG